jgi:hypothetical protein
MHRAHPKLLAWRRQRGGELFLKASEGVPQELTDVADLVHPLDKMVQFVNHIEP